MPVRSRSSSYSFKEVSRNTTSLSLTNPSQFTQSLVDLFETSVARNQHGADVPVELDAASISVGVGPLGILDGLHSLKLGVLQSRDAPP